MGWKHKSYRIINSDLGHTRSEQQLDKALKITFASPSKSTDEKEKEREKIYFRKKFASREVLNSLNSFLLSSMCIFCESSGKKS